MQELSDMCENIGGRRISQLSRRLRITINIYFNYPLTCAHVIIDDYLICDYECLRQQSHSLRTFLELIFAWGEEIHMDFELHSAIILGDSAFHVLVAPLQILIEALNSHLNIQKFQVLYVCGNHSRILSGLDRRFIDLEVQRAFTVFQLLTVLEDSRHTLMILEHDPLLYEDAEEMVEYASLAMREAAKSCIVLLYSPASDPFLEKMMNYADRVFCFAEGPRTAARPSAKNNRKAQTSSTGQTTLEGF